MNCLCLLHVIQSAPLQGCSITQHIHNLVVPAIGGACCVAQLIELFPHLLRLCVYVPCGSWFIYPLASAIVNAIAMQTLIQCLELHFAMLECSDQLIHIIHHKPLHP